MWSSIYSSLPFQLVGERYKTLLPSQYPIWNAYSILKTSIWRVGVTIGINIMQKRDVHSGFGLQVDFVFFQNLHSFEFVFHLNLEHTFVSKRYQSIRMG
jgi:hypothetical protein